MAPEVYREYTEALIVQQNRSNYKFSKGGECLTLTVKNYATASSPHPLSQRIHAAADASDLTEDHFSIKGPLGKGLAIPHEANGLYIAFAAGTGVLVFMDLVAHLVRKTLGLLEPGEERLVGDNF